jgi:hypothetical protein
MAATISGLEALGLTSKQLALLGHRATLAYAHLKTYDITRSVVRERPRDRHHYLLRRAERWITQLRRRFPERSFTTRSDTPLPSSLSVRLAAEEVAELARHPGVRSVHVVTIQQRRRRKSPRNENEWFCVRARVAVQVEAETKGIQTIEERFVLVRATSFRDAERRLRKEWREYATPYLNTDGHLVRWRCEEIVDVYAVSETHLDPEGIEVYSKLSGRRMKPEYAWHPRRGV